MKTSSSIAVLALLISLSSEAATFKVLTLWKGYKNSEQQTNLQTCLRQVQPGQKCSTNWSEHNGAVYDVALLQPTSKLKVVTLFKGWNQRDQTANLKSCEYQMSAGQLCVTSMFVHGGAAYDVALMD